MRTQKQIEASRANGSKSHGAVTPEGKARIVNANLWTGVFTEATLLDWEHEEELDDLRDEYYSCHPPHSPEARCLLDQLILCEWQLRRLHNAETVLWHDLEREGDEQGTDPVAHAVRAGDTRFARLQSRINATRRAFHTALKELERLETRDAEVVVVPKNPDGVQHYSTASTSPDLGSLRQSTPADAPPAPAPAGPPPSGAAAPTVPTHSNPSTSPSLGSLRQKPPAEPAIRPKTAASPRPSAPGTRPSAPASVSEPIAS